MAPFSLCIALASLSVVFATSSTTTSTSTCTTVTKLATFDHLPTGTLDPTTNHNGLLYRGWEVVAAKDTVFEAHSGQNILKLTGTSGTISTAKKGQYLNDYGINTYYCGCENSTANAAENCGYSMQFDVPNEPAYLNTYYGFLNATTYPHTLQPAGSGNTDSVQSVLWGVNTAVGGDAGPDLRFYMDSYEYTLSNCGV